VAVVMITVTHQELLLQYANRHGLIAGPQAEKR
jgi:hypothetical protein